MKNNVFLVLLFTKLLRYSNNSYIATNKFQLLHYEPDFCLFFCSAQQFVFYLSKKNYQRKPEKQIENQSLSYKNCKLLDFDFDRFFATSHFDQNLASTCQKHKLLPFAAS